MPMDKRRLSSQPKATLPVGQQRFDVGNRYSIGLPETLDCAVGNMAKGRVWVAPRAIHNEPSGSSLTV